MGSAKRQPADATSAGAPRAKEKATLRWNMRTRNKQYGTPDDGIPGSGGGGNNNNTGNGGSYAGDVGGARRGKGKGQARTRAAGRKTEGSRKERKGSEAARRPVGRKKSVKVAAVGRRSRNGIHPMSSTWTGCDPVGRFEEVLRWGWTLDGMDCVGACLPTVRERMTTIPTVGEVRAAMDGAGLSALSGRARQILYLLSEEGEGEGGGGRVHVPMLSEGMLREVVEDFARIRSRWEPEGRDRSGCARFPDHDFCLMRIAEAKGWDAIAGAARASCGSKRGLSAWVALWDGLVERG